MSGIVQQVLETFLAQLRANEAQLAFLRQQLADARLVAPLDASSARG